MNQSAVMLDYQLEVPLKAVPVRARNHRADIDGLRAVAVIVVIINHFHKNIVPSGYLGVDMFFVISGYVITASLARRQHNTLIDFIGTFYSARLKRLMPALLVCVAVMINDVAGFSPEKVTVESEHQLTLLKNGLSRLAVEMELKGVGIIFQSGNPFAREAGCDPDMAKSQWFNLINQPVCKYYTRDYSIERLRNLNTVLQNLQKEHRNFYILDLFDVFCAGSLCKFDNGKGEYLYRDPWSHPSVEANYLARPVFLSLVERAIRDGEHNNH